MAGKMKNTPTKKNNNNVTNPYRNSSFGLSMRLKGSPVKMGQGGRHNKVFTSKTAVDGVFASYTLSPDGKGTAYVKPMITFFNENGEELNLMELWGGCVGFGKRRNYNPEDPREDTVMPGKPGVNWGWDIMINVALSDEDTPTSIGKKIAQQFEKFTEERKEDFGSKQLYKFGADVTPKDELPPLSHLMRNEDIVTLFLYLFGDKGKDELFKNQPLLVSFFGDADVARELLNYQVFA